MKKSALPLDKNEWDFRPCVDSELEACWRYELAREKWRTNPPTPENLSLYKSISATGNPHDEVIYTMAGFPKKPWLSLDRESRKETIQKIQHEIFSIYGYLVNTSVDDEPWFRQDRLAQDVNVAAIVMHLDWRKSDTKLKKEFEAILSDLRAAKKQSKNAGGRGNIRDKLNALGARRLLRHFGNDSERAIEHMTGQSVTSLYMNERALRRAANRPLA